jgi:hypothetical protein
MIMLMAGRLAALISRSYFRAALPDRPHWCQIALREKRALLLARHGAEVLASDQYSPLQLGPAMTENSPNGQKWQLLGLGVGTFSALCTVLAALIGAGSFRWPRYCLCRQAWGRHGYGYGYGYCCSEPSRA